MKEHVERHGAKYVSFFVVAALVATISYSLFIARAFTIPTFVQNVQPVNLGHTVLNLGFSIAAVTNVDVDSAGNMYLGTTGGIVKFDAAGNLQRIGTDFVKGLRLDTEGNIFITDNSSVKKYSSTSTLILSFGSLGSGDGQLNTAEDVALDSGGNIYVADRGNHRVQKFSSTGTFLMKFGVQGTENGQLFSPSGVELDPSGNIYVTDLTGRIQKFDLLGNFVSQVSSVATVSAKRFRFDGAGNLYVLANQKMVKLDSGGNSLGEITSDSLEGAFQQLHGIAVDGSGNVYISDYVTLGMSKFNSAFVPVAYYGPIGSAVGEYRQPTDVVVDSEGNMYVVDEHKDRVIKTDSSGNYTLTIGNPSVADADGLAYAWGIDIDSSDVLYVVDGNNGVKKYDTAGNYLSTIGSYGAGDGQFDWPYDVAVDSLGNVYASDQSLYRIQKFDSSGSFLWKAGAEGVGNGQFNSADGPTSISVDSAGNVYVADPGNYRIQKFDSSGAYVSQFGSEGVGDGQFGWVQAVYVDSLGNIYVSDTGRMIISVFDSSGTFLYSFGNTGSTDAQLGQPYAMDIENSTGKLYIADHQTQRVSIWQGALPSIALSLSSVSATSTATSTTIAWESDQAGSSQVEYGITTDYGSLTAETDTSTRVTSHSVVITTPSCALLHYRVLSKSSTLTQATSSRYIFTTEGCTGSSSITATSTTAASTVSTSTLTLSTLTLSIPPEFSTTTSATTTFQALKLEPVAFFASSSLPTGQRTVGTDVYHLNALTDATTSLSSFTAPITITLSYDPNNLSGINSATLTIYRYDDDAWHALSNCTRNATLYTVTCETTEFSDFALFGAPDTSSVSYGASGFRQPDGSLSSEPPVAATGGSPVFVPPDTPPTATTSPVVVAATVTVPVEIPSVPVVTAPVAVVTKTAVTPTKPVVTPLPVVESKGDSYVGVVKKTEEKNQPVSTSSISVSEIVKAEIVEDAVPLIEEELIVPQPLPVPEQLSAVDTSWFTKVLKTVMCWIGRCK